MSKFEKNMIGTRLEEDELNKKQNFFNQKAVNEKGHSRFHGAFTGGFSAGYKGTVGSEAGFVPKTFISSRNSRAKQSEGQQQLQDYMDEEDLGGHVIGANLTTKDQFDSFSNQNNQIVHNSLGYSTLGKAPDELIVEGRKTVGWEILKNIQYSRKKKEKIIASTHRMNLETIDDFEGNEINIEELENQYKLKKEKFDSLDNYKIKGDFFGLGFQNTGFRMEQGNSAAEQEFNRLIKRQYQTEEETEIENEKKKQNNRIYTDFKKIYNYEEQDEDDDVHVDNQKQDISYEKYEVLKEEKIGQQMISSAQIQVLGLEQLVQRDPNPLQIFIKSSIIEVPDSYNPFTKMQEYIKGGGKMIEFQKQKKKFLKLNAVQRKAILEEQEEIDRIKEQIETKKFVKAKEIEQENKVEIKNPLYQSWNEQKQQRYQSWLEEKEGKGIFIQVQVAQLVSYKEMRAEKKDFERMYKETVKPREDENPKSIIDKIGDLQQKIDEIKNFRLIETWFPDKLLCRRFGVNPPYKDKEYFDKKSAELKKAQDREQSLQTKVFKTSAISSIPASDTLDPSIYGLPSEFKSNKFGVVQYKKDENDMDYNEVEEETIYDVNEKYEDERFLRKEQIEKDKKLINELEQETHEVIKEKPPISLFKSIFGDEDE